jgi:hypothetical protein
MGMNVSMGMGYALDFCFALTATASCAHLDSPLFHFQFFNFHLQSTGRLYRITATQRAGIIA